MRIIDVPSQKFRHGGWIKGNGLPLIIAFLITFWVLSSYPMMRPGLDVWVHLGLIEAPSRVDANAMPAHRIVWHRIWHQIFEIFQVSDLFNRALIIHRTQSLVTMALITISAFFSLVNLVPRGKHTNNELWLAAIFSAIIWLLMNGTASTARTGGQDSHFIQSWLIWYSINYQISLPLYFTSIGLLMYALNFENPYVRRIFAFSLSVLSIAIATILHAAETAYFLVCLVFITILYLHGRQRWRLVAGAVAFGVFIFWGAATYSYITPSLLKFGSIEDWQKSTEMLVKHGVELTQHGLNRIDTGWHAVHTVSLAALACAAFMYWRQEFYENSPAVIDWRPWIFVALTATMPLALMFTFTAGILAMITHLYIAWRFAFASLIFIAIPLLALQISSRITPDSTVFRQLTLLTSIIAIVSSVLVYSHNQEPSQSSSLFGKSLLDSLSRNKSFFGLTNLERDHLKRVADMRGGIAGGTLLCTDIYTAYYLFFVERFYAVDMPPALYYLPGYKPANPSCPFEFSPESLPRS